MANLNFNKIQKQYLTVTLRDKNKTTIFVGTPTKKLLDELISLNSSINNDNLNSDELGNELYEICAKLMSRNKGNVNIEKELLEDIFDIEDIMIFLKAYMDFVSSQAKN